ncbi:hypothetical protein [Mesorhizobium sp. B2-5-7]|uniref:hypothetical protein n=1 Tax=Mesorhizobium sp. B2-5-7 TaxID=2589923 RepID=UPI0011276B5E|nr:hypothetical protein [Mesorhizobium sp. B2-5-7]TPK18052.1 hypothetical protein FJ543_06080 [Mesorhizobium sp. B2-5-7]
MPKLAIGRRGSVPFAKIMAVNTDDPQTTANTDTGKFYFNSEYQKVGYIRDIFIVEPDFTAYPPTGSNINPTEYYYPSGSGPTNCQILIQSFTASGVAFQRWCFFLEYFTAAYGFTFLPLVEMRPTINFTTNQFKGPHVDIGNSGNPNGNTSSYLSYDSLTNRVLNTGSNTTSGGPFNRPSIPAFVSNSGSSSSVRRVLATVFDLPMHDETIPDNSLTPVSGQEVVRIDKVSPGIARVAMAGRTVTDVDASHYILHEDRIPAKVMATGTITVGALATAVITTRLPLTELTYMDYLVKKSTESTYWSPPFIDNIFANANDFSYTVSGSTVTIVSNSNFSMDIVYVIYADSGEAPTTGGKKILLKGNDGIGDYVQVKRPGSSDLGPNLNDIMLDTRLTYLPILAEGFLAWTTDFPTVISGSDLFKGVRKATIAVPNPNGLLLFPKIGAIYNPPSNHSAFNEPSAIWGQHRVFTNNATWAGKAAGYSTWANPTSLTSVDLYASGNNPWTIQPSASFYDSQLKGARYYIFGIPQSL